MSRLMFTSAANRRWMPARRVIVMTTGVFMLGAGCCSLARAHRMLDCMVHGVMSRQVVMLQTQFHLTARVRDGTA